MALQLYNTATRRKEIFAPLDPRDVRLYVCGPTVYDLAHIGNARPAIVFDVLFRLLRHTYGADHVRYVRNITDIDDKINAAAKANGESIRALTTRTAAAFHDDVAALNCLPPTVEPRATEHIPQIIAMIERLIASDHAYRAEGHVLFSVASDPQYGALSGRSRDEMIAGARVEIAPYKKDPADFVLWKPSTAEQPGWDSPWGRGRPGWHIECSAMSEAHLGETFDIHGGGLDLIFPHHENEIAQSVCAHDGRPFVRYWLHNGFVALEGEKMAKSVGNVRTIRDVLAEAPGEVARYAMLMSHYRDPLDWTEDRVDQARHALDRFYLALRGVARIGAAQGDMPPGIMYFVDAAHFGLGAAKGDMPPGIMTALEDDLNTPLALASLHDVMTELNKATSEGEKARLKGELLAAGALLGLLRQDADSWLQGDRDEAAEIEALIQQRLDARKARNFAEADRIRTELAMRGILLEDKSGGSTEWRRVG
jgi:cysteinyl-tRNA synthetase